MTVADEAPAPPLNAQRVGEISKIFEDEGIVAKGSLSSSGDNYASWKMDRDEALVFRLLDSVSADGGLSEPAKKEMSDFLKGNDNAYNILADCIVSPLDLGALANDPSLDIDEMLPIKRSYRATKILEQDVQMAARVQKSGGTLQDIEESNQLILNGTRAGLLAKKLFHAYTYDPESNSKIERKALPPHIPHVNHLLKSMLEGYASAVVSAACAGGKDGIESNLGPMLTYRSQPTAALTSLPDHDASSTASLESPLPVLAAIVSTGCTGRLAADSAGEARNPNMMLQQQQAMLNNDKSVFISKGHRRKFVRSLADWDLLTRLADCIDHPGTDEAALYRSEAACDALLSIVDNVGFPPMPPPGVAMDAKKKKEMEESVGEEQLLAPLATDDFLHHLTNCVSAGSLNNSLSASRALLGLFDLATGRSKNHSAPPALDAVDSDEVAAKAVEAVGDGAIEVINKIKKSGLTTSMHAQLVASIELVVKGMDVYAIADGGSIDTREDGNVDESEDSAVRHPGHYVIKQPFTSRRLHLISLLADILDFDEGTEDSEGTTEDSKQSGERFASSRAAIDVINALPLPPSAGGEEKGESVTYNPFPGLVDLIFTYPENNLFQIQFYRLLHSLCMTNHEGSLKIVVQKTKFVGRAIKAIKKDSTLSNKGVLLRCLNALRLLSQSLSPHSFLRHYLDSHDTWKAFQETLRTTTIEQNRPGGGIPMPPSGPPPGVMSMSGLVDAINSNPLMSADGGTENDNIDIDLGSSYAEDLGFDASILPFTGDESGLTGAVASGQTSVDGASGGAGGGSPKKKKKNKKKKKK